MQFGSLQDLFDQHIHEVVATQNATELGVLRDLHKRTEIAHGVMSFNQEKLRVR
jgi:hypothetical protein